MQQSQEKELIEYLEKQNKILKKSNKSQAAKFEKTIL